MRIFMIISEALSYIHNSPRLRGKNESSTSYLITLHWRDSHAQEHLQRLESLSALDLLLHLYGLPLFLFIYLSTRPYFHLASLLISKIPEFRYTNIKLRARRLVYLTLTIKSIIYNSL